MLRHLRLTFLTSVLGLTILSECLGKSGQFTKVEQRAMFDEDAMKNSGNYVSHSEDRGYLKLLTGRKTTLSSIEIKDLSSVESYTSASMVKAMVRNQRKINANPSYLARGNSIIDRVGEEGFNPENVLGDNPHLEKFLPKLEELPWLAFNNSNVSFKQSPTFLSSKVEIPSEQRMLTSVTEEIPPWTSSTTNAASHRTFPSYSTVLKSSFFNTGDTSTGFTLGFSTEPTPSGSMYLGYSSAFKEALTALASQFTSQKYMEGYSGTGHSTTTTTVYTFSLQNLFILVCIKGLMLFLLFGGFGVAGAAGRRSLDNAVALPENIDFKSPELTEKLPSGGSAVAHDTVAFFDSNELLFALAFLNGNENEGYGCLQRVSCLQPHVAAKILAAATLLDTARHHLSHWSLFGAHGTDNSREPVAVTAMKESVSSATPLRDPSSCRRIFACELMPSL